MLRFSVLSVGMLDRIHAAFSAEELLLVHMGLRNEGSFEGRSMFFAGRAREREKIYRKRRPGAPLINTPSCETGFKFNLPERVVRLSSPCAPDDRWPVGYRVYDEATFRNGSDVRRVLEEMIARHMPDQLQCGQILRFQRCLRYERTPGGFQLASPHLRQRFEATPETPFMGKVGDLIATGLRTAGQIAELLAREERASRSPVESALGDLFKLGVLDDEPSPLFRSLNDTASSHLLIQPLHAALTARDT